MKTYSKRKNDEDSSKNKRDPFDEFLTSDEDSTSPLNFMASPPKISHSKGTHLLDRSFEKSNNVLKNQDDIEESGGDKENIPGMSVAKFYGSAGSGNKTLGLPKIRFQNRTPTREKRSGLLSGLGTNKTLSPRSSNSETEELKGTIFDDMDFLEQKSEDVKVGRFERGRFKLNQTSNNRYTIFTQSSPKNTPSSDDDEVSLNFKVKKNEKLDNLLRSKRPTLNLSPPDNPNRSKMSPFSRSPLSTLQKKFVPPEMIGFPNAGLYCYLNAVLQALLGTNCFVNDLTNWNEQEENDYLIMSFSQLSRFKDEGNQTETRFAIRKLRTEIEKALPMKLNRMQDVHEFLVLFCESLESQYVKLGHKSNPFSENFHFQLEEQKVCCECQHLTEKIKEDFVLRLDMPSSPTKTGDLHSTQTLLKKTLHGSDIQVTCEICERNEPHVAKDRMKKLPRVLVLYLPRTQYSNIQKYKVRKDRNEIDVDVVIDLSQHKLENVDTSKVSMPTPIKIETPKMERKRSHCLSDSQDFQEKRTKISKLSRTKGLNGSELDLPSEKEQLEKAVAESLLSLKEEILPFCDSPSKTPKSSDSGIGDVLSEIDVSKLSEEEQLKRAMEESLKSHDEAMEELGVKILDEEEQLQMALDQSRQECIEKDEEENSSLKEALEASLNIEDIGSEVNQVEKDKGKLKRRFEIKGKIEATEEFEYQLTAVLSHVNSVSSVNTGHYIADVFNCQLKKWFKYDDMNVSERSLQTVIQESSFDGCLFFYSHRNIVKYENERMKT